MSQEIKRNIQNKAVAGAGAAADPKKGIKFGQGNFLHQEGGNNNGIADGTTTLGQANLDPKKKSSTCC